MARVSQIVHSFEGWIVDFGSAHFPSLLELSHTGKATDHRCAPDKIKKQIGKGTKTPSPTN